jgi:hypothetical protein
MKQCIALAALVCLAASGCAQSKMMGCGDACHVATSRRAPRPLLGRRDPPPKRGLLYGGNSDGVCPVCHECQGSPCGDGGCGPCQRCAEKIAGGFCGRCGQMGICPTGTYPEDPNFQAGPPTGQVAYPYYTVRGPRDFLLDNPPSIGP